MTCKRDFHPRGIDPRRLRPKGIVALGINAPWKKPVEKIALG